MAIFLTILCCALRDGQTPARQAKSDASGENGGMPAGSTKVSPEISFGGFNDQSTPHPSAQRSNAPRGSVLPSNGWTKSFSGTTTVYDDGKDLQLMTSSTDLVYDAMMH